FIKLLIKNYILIIYIYFYQLLLASLPCFPKFLFLFISRIPFPEGWISGGAAATPGVYAYMLENQKWRCVSL
ncbi:MAG: hypothetical protein K2J62_02880, partial [Bacteroidales bacterium]|nr:hypothetical protein [Bacteroidales bacterium]